MANHSIYSADEIAESLMELEQNILSMQIKRKMLNNWFSQVIYMLFESIKAKVGKRGLLNSLKGNFF